MSTGKITNEQRILQFEKQMLDDYSTDTESLRFNFILPKAIPQLALLSTTTYTKIESTILPILIIPNLEAKPNIIAIQLPKKKRAHFDEEIDFGEGNYMCKKCKECFITGQALGGHMSRKHPGQSEDYIHKKEVRDLREIERTKLFQAKIRYYELMGLDFLSLKKSREGNRILKSALNRSKLKKVKASI